MLLCHPREKDKQRRVLSRSQAEQSIEFSSLSFRSECILISPPSIVFNVKRGRVFLGWTREEEEEEEVAETSRGIAAFQEPALRRYSIFTLAFARQRRAPRGNINGRSFSRRVNLSLAIIDHPRAKFATIPPPDQCPAVCHLHCPVVSLSCCLVVSSPATVVPFAAYLIGTIEV